MILDNIIKSESPRAPSQAPRDRSIKPNRNNFFTTKRIKIVINISSSLNNITIKCFFREKLKKQQNIMK